MIATKLHRSLLLGSASVFFSSSRQPFFGSAASFPSALISFYFSVVLSFGSLFCSPFCILKAHAPEKLLLMFFSSFFFKTETSCPMSTFLPLSPSAVVLCFYYTLDVAWMFPIVLQSFLPFIYPPAVAALLFSSASFADSTLLLGVFGFTCCRSVLGQLLHCLPPPFPAALPHFFCRPFNVSGVLPWSNCCLTFCFIPLLRRFCMVSRSCCTAWRGLLSCWSIAASFFCFTCSFGSCYGRGLLLLTFCFIPSIAFPKLYATNLLFKC